MSTTPPWQIPRATPSIALGQHIHEVLAKAIYGEVLVVGSYSDIEFQILKRLAVELLPIESMPRPPPVLPVQILIESMPRLSRNERRLAKRNERRRLRKKDT